MHKRQPQCLRFERRVDVGDRRFLDVTTTDLIARMRDTYAGPLVVGADLMRFVIGPDVAVY